MAFVEMWQDCSITRNNFIVASRLTEIPRRFRIATDKRSPRLLCVPYESPSVFHESGASNSSLRIQSLGFPQVDQHVDHLREGDVLWKPPRRARQVLATATPPPGTENYVDDLVDVQRDRRSPGRRVGVVRPVSLLMAAAVVTAAASVGVVDVAVEAAGAVVHQPLIPRTLPLPQALSDFVHPRIHHAGSESTE